MTRRLFHLARKADWDARPDGPWEPPSLATEGFIHLSWEDQLEGTLAVHFRGAGEVILLELDPAALGDDLVEEPSRGGALFPHLYRPLLDVDVVASSVAHAP